MSRLLCILAIIAISIPLTDRASAQSCQQCGCQTDCQKVCRLVCETRKVEITCWSCKVEEFCIPGPSKPGCKHQELVCDSCGEGHDPTSPVAMPKRFVWTEWIPGCATVQTKKKLMKRTVIKTIPSYKWVVEELCDQCESNLPPVTIDHDAAAPPPPKIDAATRLLPARASPPTRF